MKFILLLSVALLWGIMDSSAQTIDGTALKDLAIEYVEIVGQTKVLSNRQFVEIAYGQEKASGLYSY
ncbi:hypothetical protein [Adhaeribacter radiodurans]|uniref:Uncharacterized protein n=1 Tax=Adhaeribacter radiodurans TaxID=2745197 RepID=A0A7L7LC54_9BACT|nr:hypothetical protein [Adhaeribacter radiodurans]QMU30428.1 hypothetical protein HUW48_21460 [Adhaeribacter radiodurans]